MEKHELNKLSEEIQFKSLPYDVDYNYNKLKVNIMNKAKKPIKEKQLRFWQFAGIAATLALLIVSVSYFISSISQNEITWYEITALPDAKTKVILPDNSIVWLNANATLSYPSSFDKKKRDVKVSGDAIFEIHKENRPFFVEANELNIKVLGTIFNVITNKSEDEIEVTLLEGKIALYKNNNLTDTPDQILLPNQKAVYYKSTSRTTVSSTKTDAVNSWITGKFHFKENSLADITTELERAFHTKIKIENEKMKYKTFNAVFEDQETLDEILSILQISAQYSIEKRRGVIYIK